MGITAVLAISAIVGALACLCGVVGIENKTHNLENAAKAVGKAVEDATLKAKLKLLLLLGIVEINAGIKPSKAENEELKNSIDESVNSMSVTHTHDIIENVHKMIVGGKIDPKPIDCPQIPQSIKDHKPIDVPQKGKELPQSGKDVITLGEKNLEVIGKDVIVLGEKEPQSIQTGTIYGGIKSNPSEKGKAQQQKSKEKTQSLGGQAQATKQKDVTNKKQEDKTLEQTFKKGLEALEEKRIEVVRQRKEGAKYGAKTSMFASSSNPNIFGVASSSNWMYNPTILIEGEEIFFEKTDDMSYEEYYNYHLSDEYLESLPESFFESLGSNKESVRIEMQKLKSRIELIKKKALDENLFNQYENPSFEYDWNVENCAEIWSARIAIMKGALFADLVFVCVHTSNGAYAPPCKNCKKTFEVVVNIGGEVAKKKKKKKE